MPDLLDAALPEPYVWEAPRGEALSAQFPGLLARGYIAVCAVSGQFVVPLEPGFPPGPTPKLGLRLAGANIAGMPERPNSCFFVCI